MTPLALLGRGAIYRCTDAMLHNSRGAIPTDKIAPPGVVKSLPYSDMQWPCRWLSNTELIFLMAQENVTKTQLYSAHADSLENPHIDP